MDTLESYKVGARRVLANIISQHGKVRYWHYGLTLGSDNCNSLAALLQLGTDEYLELFEIMGFLKKGVGRVTIHRKEWENFIVQYLGGGRNIYFDKMKVSNVQNGGSVGSRSETVTYQGWWIGFGDMKSCKLSGGRKPNPSSQFAHYTRPPRVKGMKRHVNELKQILTIIVEHRLALASIETTDDELESIEENNKKFKVQTSKNVMDELRRESVSNFSYFLDGYKDGQQNKEQATTALYAAMEEMLIRIQKDKINWIKRMKMVSIGENENIDFSKEEKEEEELLNDEEEKLKKVPALTQLGIPLIPSVLRVVLKEIVQLSNQFEKEDLLSFQNWKGEQVSMIQIPKCKNKESFDRMNRRKKFIDNLPSSIIGRRSGLEANEVRRWIMNRLGKMDEDGFVKVAAELGYNLKGKVMDQHTAEAMWDDANVNTRSQRMILRYFRATFGKRCIIEMGRKNEDGSGGDDAKHSMLGNYQPVLPIVKEKTIDGELITYWTKNIINAMSSSLSSRLYSNDEAKQNMRSIDIVFGGDHGQRKFRMVAKIIVRGETESKIIDEWVIKIGHIDCKKDSYHVLRETIGPSLDEAIRQLKGEKNKVLLFKPDNDRNGKMKMLAQIGNYNEGQGDSMSFICPLTNLPLSHLTFFKACSIRIVVTGDLAFYASATGKVNMSGNWCHWCQLSKSTWSDLNHVRGEKWTLEKMNEVRERMVNGDLPDTSENRKGVVDVELLSTVEVEDYVFPILHCEIGLGNYMLNSFLDWIDYRVENVTEEELEKRNEYSGLLIDLDELEKELQEFQSNGGVEIAELRSNRSEYREMKGFRDENNKLLLSVEERKELSEMIQQATERLKVLDKERLTIKAAITTKKQVVSQVKAKLDRYKAERGKKGEVRIQIERKLREYGIVRPTYHGGDLNGVKVKLFLQNVDKIFDDFKEIIMSCDNRQAKEEEVSIMVSMYRDLGFLMDGVFSMGRTPCGKLTAEMIGLTSRMISASMKLWRYLRLSMRGPKIHGFEDHLLEQMIRWNGIGDFTEDFVEQSHQQGVKEENRTRGLRRAAAFVSHSKWEWRSNRLSVVKAKEEVKKRTSRSPRMSSRERKKSKKLSRDEKRMGSLLVVESGAYRMIDDYRIKKVIETESNESD